MTHRVRVGLGAVLVAAIVVSGGASAMAAPGVSASKWARTVCGALSQWQQQLVVEGTVSPAAAPDAATSRAALARLFADAAVDTSTLVKKLRRAGTPSVKHGAVIAKTYVSAYTKARDGFRNAASAAGALPSGDPVAFTSGWEQLQAKFQMVTAGVATTFKTASAANPSPQLDRALAREPACRPFVPTLEPPCKAAPLLLAAALTDTSIHTISDFKCAKGWAGANVVANDTAIAVLYRAENSRWVIVDRGQFCGDPSIPATVHHYCEVS